MEFKKINGIEVKPVVNSDFSKQNVKGKKYFAEPYANIALIAPKKSGKTNLIYTITNECASTKTKVRIFASTVEKDGTYKKLLEKLESRDMDVETHTSLKEDGRDHLAELIQEMKQCEGGEVKEAMGGGLHDEQGKPILKIFCSVEEEQAYYKKQQASAAKKKKSTKLYPEWLIILDDISTELKNKHVDYLLKTNRHYKSKVIISTQWLNDLLPSSRKQFDYFILFGRLQSEKLEEAYKDADLHVSFETFLKMYIAATSEKYHFLYIDVRESSFRKDFNTEILPGE